jgi:hypothetical protein
MRFKGGMASCAASFLSLCLLAGGCGPSDQEQIQSVVKDYYRAYLSGNSVKTCALLNAEGQREMADSVGFAVADDGDLPGTCEDAVAALTSVFREGAASIAGEPDVVVRVAGSVAYATPSINGNPGNEFTLREMDGSWFIESGFTGS